jgi:hypothetical protein
LSEGRQKEMEELIYLQDQIDWRSQDYDETEISLNLETRIAKQLEEKLFNEALEERYDALKAKPYDQLEVLLDVRVEQEADSQSLKDSFATKELDEVPEEDSLDLENDEEEEPSYDIHLRESLRIMRDWVLWENNTLQRGTAFSLFPN